MRYWPNVLVGVFLAGLFQPGTAFPEGAESSQLQALQQSLGVAPTLARVTDAYLPVSGASASGSPSEPLVLPDFVLIQDVHRHPQVQSQIASLIVHGYNAWGVKKVFLEGAFTSLDLSIFHRVPNKTRALLMARLVKDGNLSGPELAAVIIMEQEWRNPPVSPFQLFGMEDARLYRQNVQAYENVLARRDRALVDLVSIRRLQTSMNLPEPNLLNDQLERVDALIHLKLTPVEYEAYLKSKDAVPSTAALDPAVHAAEEFYRLAQLRSQAFLKEAFKKVPASTAPRILVVGGFHTVMMASLLRQEGHSFVVLSPAVSSGEEAPIYEKRMQETADVLAEALVPAPH